MTSVVIPPTTETLRIADLLDRAIHEFLSAMAQEAVFLGRYESEVEARHLLFLMVRNVEALSTLARTDLILFPAACVLARAAFEIGLKAAWMMQPEDPYAGELRWLVHLKEDERTLDESCRRIRLAGGTGDDFHDRAHAIRAFRETLEQRLPPAYTPLTGNPSVEAMLRDLEQGGVYVSYKLLAQYVHGSHGATWIYRRNLGTSKQLGEFTRASDWGLPLATAWRVLQSFACPTLVGLSPEDVWPFSESLCDELDHTLRNL